MKIETSRFGAIGIEEEQIIHIPSGLIGFPNDKRYIFLEHQKDSPYVWFQSVDTGSLAFVLIDPFLFEPNYEIQLSDEDIAHLELENGGGSLQGIRPFVIVNISKGEPREITVNLLGPVVINLPKKLARQVVLYGSPYSHRFPIPLVKNEKAP